MHKSENTFLHYTASIFLFLIVFGLTVKILCRLTIGWNKSNVCLVGKTALITGGNSGLGLQTALILAGRGARIIIADKDDATESIKKIIEQTKNCNIVGKFLNLADLCSIRNFAAEINKEEERLDILINNAGVSGPYPGYTKDRLPLQMQINCLGPFLLTHLLIGLLKKSSPSRIIFVSSIMGFTNLLNVDDLNNDPNTKIRYWNEFNRYSTTKLCNALISIAFAEKLKGSGVTSNALNPGFTKTPLTKRAMNIDGFFLWNMFWNTLTELFGRTPYEGAQTHAYLAMAEEVKDVTGKFFSDCQTWFQPWQANDKKLLDVIWRRSEELVNLEPHEKI